MSITGGDVESVSSSLPSSAPGSAPGSPRNRVKFLCSHGGKILPRPADGHLKYVGGETRVISVPRDITFHDLMKKLTSPIEGEMILKYQLMPEDLDALITVKYDEDLRHMFEEHDRHELLGGPRLRAFLFPANPIIIENQMGPMDRHSLEQRYINSVNGIIVHPPPIYSNFNRPPPINTGHTTFSISSACSSPRTPTETTTATPTPSTIAADFVNPKFTPSNSTMSSMRKVRSSPSLSNLANNTQINHQIPTQAPNMSQSHHQHPCHHQNHRHPPPPHPHLHQSLKPPLDPHPHKGFGPEPFARVRSTGLADYYRYQMEHTPSHYTRPNRGGNLLYQRGSPYDEYYGSGRYERTESPPASPMARSHLHSSYISKAWDSVTPPRT